MKRKIHIIFALSAIAAVSCNKATVEAPKDELQDITFECRVDGLTSKAHISDGVK